MKNWSSRYAYSEINIQKYVPLTGGVYRLIYNGGNGYYVFYVGQTENLNRRLLEHLSSSEQDACIVRHLRNYNCYFRFIEVASLDERRRIER